MTMLKRYYRLNEAIEFLSSGHEKALSQRDVLEIAVRGDIRLCMWFDGHLSPFEMDDNLNYKYAGYPYSLRGYIQIPRWSISPNGGLFSFEGAHVVEVVASSDGMEPPKVEPPLFLGTSSVSAETGAFYTPFETSCENTFVPVGDLINLSRVTLRSAADLPIEPHRAYRSNNLSILNQTAAKWWANADPDDRTTHPNNADVVAWLIERGFSEITAKSGATIIRPEWAPSGRKPKE